MVKGKSSPVVPSRPARSPFLLGVQGIGFLLSWGLGRNPQRRLNGSTTNPGKQQDDSSIIERYCDSILVIIYLL